LWVSQYCNASPLEYSVSATKTRAEIDVSLKNSSQTIRTIFQILSYLLGLDTLKCKECGAQDFEVIEVKKDDYYIYQFIKKENKSPPLNQFHISHSNCNPTRKESPIA
jgi:hypothetical protein